MFPPTSPEKHFVRAGLQPRSILSPAATPGTDPLCRYGGAREAPLPRHHWRAPPWTRCSAAHQTRLTLFLKRAYALRSSFELTLPNPPGATVRDHTSPA